MGNLYLTFDCVLVKSKVKILQNFVAFSEYMNFTWGNIVFGFLNVHLLSPGGFFTFLIALAQRAAYWCRYRTGLLSLGVQGVPWHTQILADQLTLFQGGGQIMPT